MRMTIVLDYHYRSSDKENEDSFQCKAKMERRPVMFQYKHAVFQKLVPLKL